MTASPNGKGRKKTPNKDDNYTFRSGSFLKKLSRSIELRVNVCIIFSTDERRGNFANRPMTASTLGGMDDDTLSLGTVQTDHLSSASIEKNYCRIIKLLIHNGIPKYEIKCPFVLPGKRYSIHATFKRSKLFPKLTTEKNNSFFQY